MSEASGARGALPGGRLFSRIRRNHALEHATLHVLSERYRPIRLMGNASPWGFCIYGAVPTEAVRAAAEEALRRLRNGERHLAVHPTCGSTLAVAGVLAGLGAFLVLGGRARGWLQRLRRLPLAWLAATLGIVLAQPLGLLLQARLTTQAEVGNLRIVGVARMVELGIPVHCVRTEG